LAAAPASFPQDLSQVEVSVRKRLFLQALAPAVVFHNAAIRAQRRRLQHLLDVSWTPRERDFVAEMIAYYRLGDQDRPGPTPADTVRALLKRVDVVPASIVLAQAAMESGWGTSRFARHGNNLFGQRVWTLASRGLAARDARESGFRLAVFSTLGASIGSYLRNVNSHSAYEDFRRCRWSMRERAEPLDPLALVQKLTRYSTRGQEYVGDVSRIIRYNKLERYDALVLETEELGTN